MTAAGRYQRSSLLTSPQAAYALSLPRDDSGGFPDFKPVFVKRGHQSSLSTRKTRLLRAGLGFIGNVARLTSLPDPWS
ncbi:hypothetical protein AGR1A_Cc30010 [Agrobacterium fabacearum CFBP 5771]|nr:hypothetical protein AGR1A_Cc30010 [Agrobacterium fabacearum CFBP 5771]